MFVRVNNEVYRCIVCGVYEAYHEKSPCECRLDFHEREQVASPAAALSVPRPMWEERYFELLTEALDGLPTLMQVVLFVPLLLPTFIVGTSLSIRGRR